MKHEHISNETAVDKEEVSSRASKISTSPTLKKQDAAAPKPLICTKCKTGMCYTGESFPMIPRVHIEGSTLIAADIAYNARSSDSTDWGNVLSIYWAGRTMAHLGGYQYQGGKIVKSITWMDYLPKNAPAHYGKNELFQDVCNNCGLENFGYTYFHRGECAAGWGNMVPTIQNDTQHALMEYSKEVPKEEYDAIFGYFKENDWLIYNRCCVFSHHLYAPGVISTYDSIPSEGEFNVYIMSGVSRKVNSY